MGAFNLNRATSKDGVFTGCTWLTKLYALSQNQVKDWTSVAVITTRPTIMYISSEDTSCCSSSTGTLYDSQVCAFYD